MKVTGYAAVFNAVDRGRDIIRPGAFRRLPRDPVPLLWQHVDALRIGQVTTLTPDEHGLFIGAELANTPAARAIWQLILSRYVDGLSFGYRTRAFRGWRYRELIDVDLLEISIVAEPMQPQARIFPPMEGILGGWAEDCEDGAPRAHTPRV